VGEHARGGEEEPVPLGAKPPAGAMAAIRPGSAHRAPGSVIVPKAFASLCGVAHLRAAKPALHHSNVIRPPGKARTPLCVTFF